MSNTKKRELIHICKSRKLHIQILIHLSYRNGRYNNLFTLQHTLYVNSPMMFIETDDTIKDQTAVMVIRARLIGDDWTADKQLDTLLLTPVNFATLSPDSHARN